MKKIICLIIFINIQLLGSKIGIVDTNILLIKDSANDDSNKLGYYKINDEVEVIDEIIDNNGKKWIQTKKGYVSSKYVFLKENLGSFINNSEVDENLYSLRLASYDINAVFHKQRLKRILANENNIFIKYYKNIYVVYLVNINSLDEAQAIQKNYFNIFPNSVIYSKQQNKNFAKNSNIYKKNSKNNKKIDNINNVTIAKNKGAQKVTKNTIAPKLKFINNSTNINKIIENILLNK